MKLFRRFAAFAIAAVVLAAIGSIPATVSAQDDYPNKPIRMILPWSAGGASSALMHMLGPKLAEELGQPVVIDNKPGANSVIGTNLLAKAPPDGYTLMMTVTGHVMLQHWMPNLPFDVIRDFTAVTTLTSTHYTMVVNPQLPVSNLKEFIALVKSKPTEFFYGESGGSSLLAAEQFNLMTGTRMQRVPYANKGAAAVLNDIMGGQIHAFFGPGVVQYVKAGRLKALAISGEKRSPTLPDVPTFAEAGLPDFEVRVWFGILAPAGTPKPIVEKLSAALNRILATPDVTAKLAQMDLEPYISRPDEFDARMKSDKDKYSKVIAEAQIKF